MATCRICGREFLYSRSSGHRRNRCNSCISNHQRYERKKKMVEYKGGKCEVCGYDRCLEALTFHHDNPEEKDFVLSGNHCRSWKLVKAELDKCSLLCRNCHAEVESRTIAANQGSIP